MSRSEVNSSRKKLFSTCYLTLIGDYRVSIQLQVNNSECILMPWTFSIRFIWQDPDWGLRGNHKQKLYLAKCMIVFAFHRWKKSGFNNKTYCQKVQNSIQPYNIDRYFDDLMDFSVVDYLMYHYDSKHYILYDKSDAHGLTVRLDHGRAWVNIFTVCLAMQLITFVWTLMIRLD